MNFFVHKGELYATDREFSWFRLATNGMPSPEFWTWNVLTYADGREAWLDYNDILSRDGPPRPDSATMKEVWFEKLVGLKNYCADAGRDDSAYAAIAYRLGKLIEDVERVPAPAPR